MSSTNSACSSPGRAGGGAHKNPRNPSKRSPICSVRWISCCSIHRCRGARHWTHGRRTSAEAKSRRLSETRSYSAVSRRPSACTWRGRSMDGSSSARTSFPKRFATWLMYCCAPAAILASRRARSLHSPVLHRSTVRAAASLCLQAPTFEWRTKPTIDLTLRRLASTSCRDLERRRRSLLPDLIRAIATPLRGRHLPDSPSHMGKMG
jgi:hypothetical protein